MSSPLGTYDCNGFKLNYIPNIGIDSASGKIAIFEKFSRSKFCDASFLIIVSKDDSTVTSKVYLNYEKKNLNKFLKIKSI